jgi:hypothetical protein
MHVRIVSSLLPLNSSQATGVRWRFQILMSRVFASDKCTQALMDIVFFMGVGTIVGAEEGAESSEGEE